MDAMSAAMVDEQKPSLFELLSEQQLHGLLPPTLRYLLTVATQRYPRYLLRALNSFDELYALAMVVVEHYYLRTMGGTFTEHFYGLKRERVLEGGGRGRHGSEVPRAASGTPAVVRTFLQLSRSSDLWRNLAVIVGVPYLKRKLDAAYELDAPRARLGAAYQRLPANPTLRDRLRHAARWFLRNVYPSVHAAYGFAILAFNLAYLFDGSRYASPLLWLVSTRVRRMTGADYRAIDDAAEERAAAASSSSSSPSVGGKVLGSLSMVLPASIFALKFLEWWHASDFAKQLSLKAAANLDLPPPLSAGLLSASSSKPGYTGTSTTAANTNASNTGSIGRKGILKKESSRRTEETPAEGQEEGAGAGAGATAASGDAPTEEEELARTAPIAKPSLLPIYTVPAPTDSALCPICTDNITTPTACQTGVVYCYICIHKWVSGQHDKQETFMEGKSGRWESGEGRCAVTGRRVLGGTEGLRRLMV
ncbi:ubiquitin-protein ligase peroxin 12 [Sporothrix curviconia]|uniref:Peroxisome assembly protein 12 n=1 Tax=Sporothrix curviconia TaxID=1260050 RepID=A0ABP0C8P0_9PEZI